MKPHHRQLLQTQYVICRVVSNLVLAGVQFPQLPQISADDNEPLVLDLVSPYIQLYQIGKIKGYEFACEASYGIVSNLHLAQGLHSFQVVHSFYYVIVGDEDIVKIGFVGALSYNSAFDLDPCDLLLRGRLFGVLILSDADFSVVRCTSFLSPNQGLQRVLNYTRITLWRKSLWVSRFSILT